MRETAILLMIVIALIAFVIYVKRKRTTSVKGGLNGGVETPNYDNDKPYNNQ